MVYYSFIHSQWTALWWLQYLTGQDIWSYVLYVYWQRVRWYMGEWGSAVKMCYWTAVYWNSTCDGKTEQWLAVPQSAWRFTRLCDNDLLIPDTGNRTWHSVWYPELAILNGKQQLKLANALWTDNCCILQLVLWTSVVQIKFSVSLQLQTDRQCTLDIRTWSVPIMVMPPRPF